jgi:RNA polymerase sigma-70 factor (ECF subfamily)
VNAPRPESRLIADALSGEVGAFEHLYRAHVGRIFALCRRMEPGEAEELTQRIFVRAWEKLSSFRGNSAFASWLHRLALNEIFSERRRRMRRPEVELMVLPDPRAHPPATRIDLEQAIAKLPRRARQVLVLYEIEGYKHAEVAEIMGISAGTSKGQLHRARRLLREVMT